jgi:hypothetical protein
MGRKGEGGILFGMLSTCAVGYAGAVMIGPTGIIMLLALDREETSGTSSPQRANKRVVW